MWLIDQGSCGDVLTTCPSASVDALVTDPPAGIGFMGKTWDKPTSYGFAGERTGGPPGVNLARNPTCRACGGRKRAGPATRGCSCGAPDWNDVELRLRDRGAFVSFLTGIMREALRVLKPGAHGLVWALPRTSHWTATALEDAGFEIRDVITHIFATGFPKSLNLGEGRGTALKPASEHWILVRAPLDGKTVLDRTTTGNVERWGTGGLEIDACRIGGGGQLRWEKPRDMGYRGGSDAGPVQALESQLGRWPANVVYSHTEWCEATGRRTIRGSNKPGKDHGSSLGLFNGGARAAEPRRPHEYTNDHGLEEIESWACVEGCPVLALDEQSGERKSGSRAAGKYQQRDGSGIYGASEAREEREITGSTGGASRFFFCAKPSPGERDYGLEGFEVRSPAELTGSKEGAARLDSPRTGAGRKTGRKNHHPTVKSIALMRYLCRLVTPPGGIVLDPFTGSGTTGCAAVLEGRHFLGIEQDAEYVAIARARIGAWEAKLGTAIFEAHERTLTGGR